MVRDGSDHALLHVLCKAVQIVIKKPFRFLNFWARHHTFKEVVRKSWELPCEGPLFKVLNEKLKW